MKHTLLALSILAAALGFCLFSALHVRAQTQRVNESLAEARNAAARNDFSTAAERLHAAKKDWHAHERFFGIVLDHGELDGVNADFSELAQYAALGDRDDFLAVSARLVATIEHIRDMELPSYHNLF